MTGVQRSLPSSQVLKALRRFGGFGLDISLPRAIQLVTNALERGIELPRSGVLDLASMALDPTVVLNREDRIKAAKALSPFNEREIVRKAALAIRDPWSPLDVVIAAATLLLGSPKRRLSHPTFACLARVVRRFRPNSRPSRELTTVQ